ncbi:MAG: DNA starvation/stationary phase protection protein, partial [Rhodococcus sp. (in: high G+C Gram-positive bacteria)]
RKNIEEVGEIDPITEDMLIGQSAQLELFHWFVRAHLENSGGQLSTANATSEIDAATQAG